MANTKLFLYLSRLTPAEWELFDKYLDSALLGNSKLCRQFLQEAKAFRPFDDPLSVRRFSLAANKDGKYSTGDLNRIYSKMLDKLFSFLSWLEFERNEKLRQSLLLHSMANRGWREGFLREFLKQDSNEGSSTIRNSATLLDGAVLELLKIDVGIHGFGVSMEGAEFQPAIDALDQGYFLAGLDLAVKAANRDMFSGVSHRLPKFLNLDGLGTSFGSLPLILQAIWKMYQPEEDQETAFQQAKQLLFDAIGQFDSNNRRMFLDLFTHLTNFAARGLLSGKEEYRAETRVLYDFMLLYGVFLQDGELSVLHYQNVAMSFFKIGDLERAEEFLHEYKHHLPVPNRENTFQLNFALLCFYRMDFSKAKKILIELERQFSGKEDFEFLLRYKVYQIVLTVECRDWERAADLAGYFSRWLRKSIGMESGRKSSYLEFAKLSAKVAILIGGWEAKPQVPKLDALVLAIEGPKAPILKDWLLQKLEHVPKMPPKS